MPDSINRFVLPTHDPPKVSLTTEDKDRDTSFPPITEPSPPGGAPNVLIALLDEIGFGASSGFGGGINTGIPMLFSGDETLDVGVDYGSPVSDDDTPLTSRFTGSVNCVQLDQGADHQSHLISPEDRLSVALVRQ